MWVCHTIDMARHVAKGDSTMRFRIMQHNDHDWRESCSNSCDDWRVVEADSAEDAVVKHFTSHPNVRGDLPLMQLATTARVKTLAEGVYTLNFGDSDEAWFAFQVEFV